MTETLRAQLVRARETAGFSMRRLAKEIGVTPGAITRIESGENDPKVKTVEGYARACGGELVLVCGPGASLVASSAALLPEDSALLARIAGAVPKIDAATRASLEAFADFAEAVAARQGDQRHRGREAG